MQYISVSVSAEKVSAPIPIPKFNPGFGSRYRYRISVAHYHRCLWNNIFGTDISRSINTQNKSKYNLLTALASQIREQILVPDLYVFTVESVVYKKKVFFMFSGSIFFKIFFYATFQCGRYNVKKIILKQSFFAHEKLKKTPKKVAHNRPKPLYSTVQPTAENWFSILWNLGTRHLFSYLWLDRPRVFQDFHHA